MARPCSPPPSSPRWSDDSALQQRPTIPGPRRARLGGAYDSTRTNNHALHRDKLGGGESPALAAVVQNHGPTEASSAVASHAAKQLPNNKKSPLPRPNSRQRALWIPALRSGSSDTPIFRLLR